MKNTIQRNHVLEAISNNRVKRFLWTFVAAGILGFAHAGLSQTTIACGQTINGSTITATQTNTYSFTGSAGQIFLVAFYWSSTEAGSADIYFPGATSPSTNVTAAGDANAITLTLPSSGTYTISVHSAGDKSTSGYDLSLQSPIGGGCSGYSVTCGQYIEGVIQDPTQMDSYELVANAGESVGFLVSGFSGAVVDVYDPSGSNTVAITTSDNYTFADTGIYTVLVHSASYAGTGEYTLLMSPVAVGCGVVADVTISPPSQTTSAGSSVTFTAVVTNDAPPNYFYRWYFDNTAIAGATNSTYVIPQVQVQDGGTYSVIVNNPDGASTSPALALLTVTTNSLNTPILNWPSPHPITYGAALTANQLDATATWAGTNVPGVFNYSPTNGAVLGAGNQTLSVSFTPGNPSVFTTASDNASLTVSQAPLVVTANNASRTYGAPNPAFSGGLSGLVNSDNITASYTCSASGATPVGGYAILPILSDPDNRLPNYVVTTNDGVLTVTQAPLTITANSTNKPFGQTLTFAGTEFTATGLQNGETVGSVTLTSAGAAATATVADSPYNIIPSGAAGGTFSPGNYSINYVDGLLTVTPVNLASLDLHMYAGLNITGPSGTQYAIQFTQGNQTNWTTLTNVTVGAQPYLYIDYASGTNPGRIYQLIITNTNSQ